MGVVSVLEEVIATSSGIQANDLERWRQAGYAAIDKLVDQLKACKTLRSIFIQAPYSLC